MNRLCGVWLFKCVAVYFLPSFSAGVYEHTTGQFLGGHAVKILGWGVDKDKPYWIIANSWNPSWGLKGAHTCIHMHCLLLFLV